MSVIKYFRGAIIVTVMGLLLAAWLGWVYFGTLGGVVKFFTIGAILAVLEISLSFDNAIVNANKLKTMSEIWRKRFLTWGILIAVFGMRVVFPVLIVVAASGLGPIEAIKLAINEPVQYAKIVGEAHVSIAGFGGTFLMMVALSYFVDEAKEVHWIGVLERWMRKFASVRGVEVASVLLIVLCFSSLLPKLESARFLFASIAGLFAFLCVELIGHILDKSNAATTVTKGGVGAFLYLEVLDASFSFDGVIGAFALTQNLFLIAIGLGIGAMYVRSMTIMLVEKETLAEFRYLEHGAFWSILILSILMFLQTLWHVSEVVTGLLGALFIAMSLISSISYRRSQK
ncbi:MAG: DUF475 domain-containing protein [Alphaproteobacteria bacterium]|nr:DUF475 domain-containing protein [Alphaproteobacteria bacterium]